MLLTHIYIFMSQTIMPSSAYTENVLSFKLDLVLLHVCLKTKNLLAILCQEQHPVK